LGSKDLPKFTGPAGMPLLQDIKLPGTNRHARAIGMRIHPFVVPEEMERMKERGRVIDPKTLPYTLVVAGDAKPVHRVLARLRWILGAGTLLTLGLGFVLIDRAVHVSFRPIRQLARQLKDRTGRQLYTELDMPERVPSELTGLAQNMNSLLRRVAATRRREHDFIRHAAHELRTPIAGLRATTELALSQHRDAAAYAGHLETCRTTTLQLGELVKRLSALARIGQASSAVSLQSVDLAKLMDECLQTFLPEMERRGLKVRLTNHETPHPAIGDSGLIRIVFNNLLDNAASYTPEGKEIAIRFLKADGMMEVSVSNPTEKFTEDPESLFEPLFRREASRHDSESHLGIGLTLSQEAARAMDGTLIARWTDQGWIEFVFSLPPP
jgi:signal transduction histidine kinase